MAEKLEQLVSSAAAHGKESKQPPAEDAETSNAKGRVIFSFWAVVLLLGLPVWLWTTSIYRASLPTQDMLAWANGKACGVDIPLIFDVKAPKLTSSQAKDILHEIEKVMVSGKSFEIHRIEWQLTKTLDESLSSNIKETALSIEFREDSSLSTPVVSLLPQSQTLQVQYSPAMLQSNFAVYLTSLGKTVAEELEVLYAEEQSNLEHLFASYPGCTISPKHSTNIEKSIDHSEVNAQRARRRTRSLKYAPTYHISISLFTSGPVPTSWDIEAGVLEYLTPLLDSFSISNFTVDTQLQLYAPFSSSMKAPEFDGATQKWTLREEDLGGFIDTANWPLSPNIGAGPTLNFILYIPEGSMRPLVIDGSSANSWVVPQWGGVSIFNQLEQIPSTLTKEQLRPALLTFSRQLLSLLGASENSASFPQQLQMLTRFHTVSLMMSASSTLASLAQLAESLATIPIPEDVALRVTRALGHLQLAQQYSQAGSFKSALDNARLAEAEAEKAFFEKDMVSQVYFPDEHKVAVYLPLLGPIGVTLLASLFKEVKRRRTAPSR